MLLDMRDLTVAMLLEDKTSDAVKVLLRHYERENVALLICVAALLTMLVMGIIRMIRPS